MAITAYCLLHTGPRRHRRNRLHRDNDVLLQLHVRHSCVCALEITGLTSALCSVTVILVGITLAVITAYFYAGLRSYRNKLQLIPRNCLRCGLPVLESEVARNDEESLNPFVLARVWWRSRRFADAATSVPAATANSEGDTKANGASSANIGQRDGTVQAETRRLKREFGMSQVRTPYLGIFRSVHKECPVKQHTLSGVILERTVRSNLRVWQARMKLRMNYLTYRNKCLKLYCWIALFLYPTVSKTILAIFNCQEIGDVYYLVQDRRIVCYNSTWFVFGVIAMVGVAVWVVGIPFSSGCSSGSPRTAALTRD